MPVASGTHPGLAFGHGFLQGVSKYESLVRHYASWGLISVAPTSQGGLFRTLPAQFMGGSHDTVARPEQHTRKIYAAKPAPAQLRKPHRHCPGSTTRPGPPADGDGGQ
ncbi:hypothetical protein [Streptomyces sp. NPDC052012]|uniref:hypothetical protein n=1 Tax=Streptomyces sp. NPDC052012 TaxID=3155051 RepID=UPI00344FF72A